MRASTHSSHSRHRSVRALTTLLLAATVAVGGCSAVDRDSGAKSESAAREDAKRDGGAAAPEGGRGSAADSQSGSKKAPDPVGTHIIRTASLTVRVKDVPKALGTARDATLDAGGVVGSETTDRDRQGRERSRVVLRVPQEKYEDVMTALAGTGKLIERKKKAEDVTEQVVDVESRVKSQRASVARVRELMDQAAKLSDVVTLEGELSSRQAELESLLARRASLKDRTTMATITLVLSETAEKKAKDEDDDPTFLSAIAGGWNAFVTGLHWIAIALGAALPFAAALGLLFVVWRLVRARLTAPSED
ncbi:DUF4349 domain-containing protein [Streptomyces sp. E11-3]|uniref:DUF4349 domain-containing protein n=1 Tax=Streptomyces sp. E11-3 TaxID=3110112 RepID=UPI0039803B1D